MPKIQLIKFYDNILNSLNIENELKLQFLILFFCFSLLIKILFLYLISIILLRFLGHLL